MVRAALMRGQQDKAQAGGRVQKGLSGAGQKALLDDFRSSRVNVLVATSVGEEGLDVAEVDLVVQYDCPSEAGREIQRSGRTGRKRKGRVVNLIGQDEAANWAKLRGKKAKLAKQPGGASKKGAALHFSDASSRIIPRGINPQMVRKSLAVQEEVPAVVDPAARRPCPAGPVRVSPSGGPSWQAGESNPVTWTPESPRPCGGGPVAACAGGGSLPPRQAA